MSKSTTVKASKNVELKKQSAAILTIANGHACQKEAINGDDLVHDAKFTSTWVCRNLSCKDIVTSEDSFCKRCSCCICHQFDDNKDPSLWLVCASENDDRNCCGSSCHIECAFQHKKVGCFDLGKIIHLDGSYSCASCGKVSGILSYWRRQLVIAEVARRVDILCHHIYVSYRLLEGTSHFKELHAIIEDAKGKLEREVGPLDGMSAKMARGIVSRLCGGSDVQKLCTLAIQKADEWLSSPDLHLRDSLPAACRFRFLDITSSSLVIILKETALASSDTIKGYKLWYWKSREQPSIEEPVILSKDQRKILVFNLSTCTEYSFRIISFTDDGILGHSESKCYTGSNELFTKRASQNAMATCSQAERRDRSQASKSTGFKIRDVGKILRKAWAEDGYFEDMHEDSCDRSATEAEQPENSERDQLLAGACRRLQFNAFSVPDLNVEAPMPMDTDSSPEKCYDLNSKLLKSDESGGSEACAAVRSAEPPAVESRPGGKAKQLHGGHDESCEQDGVSAICREKQLLRSPMELDEDYEYCVNVIRWLETGGHIETDFRMKFLTWLSLRSTENEHRVVATFIKTLIKEPSSLAEHTCANEPEQPTVSERTTEYGLNSVEKESTEHTCANNAQNLQKCRAPSSHPKQRRTPTAMVQAIAPAVTQTTTDHEIQPEVARPSKKRRVFIRSSELLKYTRREPSNGRSTSVLSSIIAKSTASSPILSSSVRVTSKTSGFSSSDQPQKEPSDVEDASRSPKNNSPVQSSALKTPSKVLNKLSPTFSPLNPSKASSRSLSKPSVARELLELDPKNALPNRQRKDSRRKDMSSCSILFSHHLNEDVIKRQKKILARLGVREAFSISDATHFVADSFFRTMNMLEAITLGKLVVTSMWLESCGQAGSFVDDKKYILRDAKKEKEIGFSMPISLASACKHPLLLGKRVFVTPNVKPSRQVMTSLVSASSGQPLERIGRSIRKEKEAPDDLLVISCEEDYESCVPLLEKGGKVFGSELLLNGIVIQKLEYERHRLFSDRVKQTRSTRWLKHAVQGRFVPVSKS